MKNNFAEQLETCLVRTIKELLIEDERSLRKIFQQHDNWNLFGSREIQEMALVESLNEQMVLHGLAAEAKKAGSYENFQYDYQRQLKHGRYYHVTHDPHFQIDPDKGPIDASSMSAGSSPTKGKLMITSHLDNWADYYGKARPHVAIIDMSEVPRHLYQQVNRGFGNEFMVHDPSKARVHKVVSLAQAKKLDAYHHSKLPSNEEQLRAFYLQHGK